MESSEKILFVASTGGHLAQLNLLQSRFSPQPESVWMTFRSPQSESLLAGRRVQFVPYVRPRDYVGVMRTFHATLRLLQREKFDRVVSTGAGIALGAFAAARLERVPCRYIESVSRVNGPSLTGRIVAATASADLYTQHAGWATKRWNACDPVLANFVAEEVGAGSHEADEINVFTTLGTIRPYRFDSLVEAVLATGAVSDRSLWQLGETRRSDLLPGTVSDHISTSEFEQAAKGADVVVTHAGVGTILQLLEWGIHPVVVPRRKDRREHVDNHQLQIAALLRQLEIGTVREVDELSSEDLARSARMRTVLAGA